MFGLQNLNERDDFYCPHRDGAMSSQIGVFLQCDVEGCSLVVTTGGTGPAVRDVTPEATEAVSN